MTDRSLIRRARNLIQYGRQQGAAGVLALLRAKHRQWRAAEGITERYAFVHPRPVGQPLAAGDVATNTVNWVIPPAGRSSGGHLNIFRFVHHLEEQGFDCRLVIVGEPMPLSAEQAAKDVRAWSFPLKAQVHLGLEQAPPAHVTIATAWQTAYAVRDLLATRHRAYFVQDFEPWFYPVGTEHVLAEATYRFGFTGITAGGWLRDRLSRDYGMTCHAVGFSYDRDLYAPEPRPPADGIPNGTRRVLFYARPSTPRRAFELGVLVLEEVARRRPEVEVIFAGCDVSGYKLRFTHRNAGILTLDRLPDLYRRCDAALVLSFTNLSLLPLELMACGTPVISNRAPCTEWLLDDGNARLAEPTVEALAEAVVAVLDDPAEAERLRAGGLAAARATDWRAEAERMAAVLRALPA